MICIFENGNLFINQHETILLLTFQELFKALLEIFKTNIFFDFRKVFWCMTRWRINDMQTKNINAEREPNNNGTENSTEIQLPEVSILCKRAVHLTAICKNYIYLQRIRKFKRLSVKSKKLKVWIMQNIKKILNISKLMSKVILNWV